MNTLTNLTQSQSVRRTMVRHKRRFTEGERKLRILSHLDKAGRRGMSVREIAEREHLSLSRTYFYLRLIRRDHLGKNVRIERLGRRFYHVQVPPVHPKPRPVRVNVAAPLTPVWTTPLHGDREVELRGYLNYASSGRSRGIDIDCVTLVRYNESAIVTGSVWIKSKVEARLGSKLASMLKFGVSGASTYSGDHFLFRRQGRGWVEF